MICNVLEYLESACENFPRKVLVGDIDRELTYNEFQKMACTIGTQVAQRNIYKEPIAILIDRDAFSVVAFMGAVYAGCVYVPIDKNLPVERIETILAVVTPKMLMVHEEEQEFAAQLAFKGEIAVIEKLLEGNADHSLLGNIRKNHIDTDPLYIIFTSGSTGVPKGVVVSHKSVIDLAEQFQRVFLFTSDDVFANQAPFDFDVSIKDWYLTLKCAGAMQIVPKSMFVMPKTMVSYLNERKVSVIIWAASALGIVATFQAFKKEAPHYLRKIMFSGEVLPVKVLHYWQQHIADAEFINLYGPTEITCNCTYYIVDREFTPEEALPIGKPFPNTEILLLSEKDKEVQMGEIGEICVRGSSLALGYYNAGEISHKVFCQNPLHALYRDFIYRTGDLGYFNKQGELFFASRKDSQIKHMGHRIELGEIETIANGIDEIEKCCSLYDENKGKIILIYQARQEQNKDILEQMQKNLPKYMCPNRMIYLQDIPMNSHDKIDRTELRKKYLNG